MVAADVDNSLFDMGAPDNNDGSATANLTYRITALYRGRDGVLGASAGLKHFGIRRLDALALRIGRLYRLPLRQQTTYGISIAPAFFQRQSMAWTYTELTL